MTRVEELEHEADKLQKEVDWVSPARVRYPGGCMSLVLALGCVFKKIQLIQIRREIAGLPPIEARPEQKGEVT